MQKLVALSLSPSLASPPTSLASPTSSLASPTTSLASPTPPIAPSIALPIPPLRRTLSLDESFIKKREKKEELGRGPVKVYDYLYLGSRASGSRDVARLKALGISHIIDCAKEYREMDLKEKKEKGRRRIEEREFKTLHLDLYDDERIVQQFRGEAERAIQFIKDTALKQRPGKVFVCCHLGTSRSAGIVLAYMMRKQDLDYSTALGQLRNLCAGTDQVILPNQYIEDMLQMWE